MNSFKFIKPKNKKTLLSVKDNKKPVDFTKKSPKNTHAEYHETLYSEESSESQHTPTPLILRDIPGIEKNVDTLNHHERISADSDIERKVDAILSNPPKFKKPRKPANVIYVVSRPQPGQVKGDWAVRSHGKIFSHHRTKLAAIDKAREIAKKRDATVLVQNTDGTFSTGFKPRK